MFKVGDEVTVYNQRLSGEPIIEGRARIVGYGEVRDQYKVRFLEEPKTSYARFVYRGECQNDPEAYITRAQAEWRERE